MASKKAIFSKLGAISFIAASFFIAPSSFAQRQTDNELAGAPSMGPRDSFEKSPVKAFHTSHNDRHSDRRHSNDRDRHSRDRDDDSRRDHSRHDSRRYHNDHYNRHWDRADHNYNTHRNRNYQRDNTYTNNRRHHDSYRRYTHHRYTINRPYWRYSHNDYPRNRRYYGSRHHGHYHNGYDHLYCPDHSGSRYHIGGYYNRGGTSVVISNYDRYGLHRPPRGHHWIRDHDRGDAILASIATGAIIGLVVGAIIADDDNDHRRYRHDRRHRY